MFENLYEELKEKAINEYNGYDEYMRYFLGRENYEQDPVVWYLFNYIYEYIENDEAMKVIIPLFEKDFQKGIPEAMKLIGKYKEKYRHLAGQLFSSLKSAGFFQEEQVGMELADQVVDMAYQALKTIPSKENLLYLSVAYARKGDYKKAFELMAGEPFFPSPVLSNALYKYLNLPVFHRDYIK